MDRSPQPLVDVEPFQHRAWDALCGPATHVLLYGGARSGKTYLIVLWLVLRALARPKATHAVLRFRFNHLKASIINDTLPAVCAAYWPGQQIYELNKSDFVAEFVGGGLVYFGGLDDKVRTEKILGQGHSTVYLNEVSQISFKSRLTASTRLSQDRGLRLKEVCDCNPPAIGHWTERLWIKGLDPSSGAKLGPEERARLAFARMNPAQNPFIPEETKAILRALPKRERERFWDGNFGEGAAGALWTYESIERARVGVAPEAFSEIVVVVDPSGCSGPEDKRSDEVGIVVMGKGQSTGAVYVLEDASGRFGPSGPEGWGARIIEAFHRWGADRVVAEVNFGGAMVRAVLVAASATIDGEERRGADLPFRELHASRGKHVRAEPVATLCDQTPPKLLFVGHFPELEEQLPKFSSSGYQGERSPDRADAMVWGAYALGVVRAAGMNLLEFLEAQATQRPTESAPAPPTGPVTLRAPSHIPKACTYMSSSGRAVIIGADGLAEVPAEDVELLSSAGFVPA